MSASKPQSPHVPLLLIWSGAFALAAIGAALVHGPAPDFYNLHRLRSPVPDIAFVGTSLMRCAVPFDEPLSFYQPSANPRGRTVRITRNSESPANTVKTLNACVKARASLILVQTEPFLLYFDFSKFLPDPSQNPPHSNLWLARTSEFSDRLRRGLRLSMRLPTPGGDNAPALDDPLMHQTFDGLQIPYKPEIIDEVGIDLAGMEVGPELHQVIATAKKNHVRVVFVAMPRSDSAARALGESFEQKFSENLRRFATEFSVEVWRPAVSWPDSYFFDHAHMNQRGRTAFVSAVQAWLADQRQSLRSDD
jgi:hypothetical protein